VRVNQVVDRFIPALSRAHSRENAQRHYSGIRGRGTGFYSGRAELPRD
jgi:hypothetical protein